MHYRAPILAGLGFLLLSVAGVAQDDFGDEEDLELLFGDEESVTIATGSSKPVRLAPSVASVITAADIKAIGATDLDEVLETVPGLHVSRSFDRLNSIYSIRGIHTAQNAQVLLLVDGIPVTQAFTGGRAPTYRVPVEGIARVEVIRGPGSAIHGADAFAGVINVITKKARDIDGVELGARIGSFDSRDAWAQYGGDLGDWEVAFSLEASRSDGDSDRTVRSDLQSALDSEFGTSASLAPGELDTRYETLSGHLQLARGNWQLGLMGWRQDDGGLGPGAAQALDHRGGQDVEQYLLDVGYKNKDLVQDWEFGASASYQYLDGDGKFNLFPPGTVLPIGEDGNVNFSDPAGFVAFPDGLIGHPGGTEQTGMLEMSAIFEGLDRHRIRFGLGYKYQDVDTNEHKNFGPGVIDDDPTASPVDGTLTNVTNTPYIFMEDEDRKIWFLMAQDEWAFAPDWELTAGIRYDHYSDFGSTVNPRLALVWATRRNLTTKLLYGRAFRAPSFGEEFAINNPVILGNKDLDPETIDTLELAFDYRPSFNLQTGLNLFYYEIDDLIEYVPDPAPATTNTAQNAKNQEGYGFEVEANWKPLDRLQLRGNYAWQHSEDERTNDTVADAPGQQVYLNANWRFLADWSLDTDLVWVADRERAASDTRDDIDDYTLVGITLRSGNIARHWQVAASVNNLFDIHAREPSNGAIADDYPLAGRSVYAELRYLTGGR